MRGSIFFLFGSTLIYPKKQPCLTFFVLFPTHLPWSDLFLLAIVLFFFFPLPRQLQPKPLFWGNARLVCLTRRSSLELPVLQFASRTAPVPSFSHINQEYDPYPSHSSPRRLDKRACKKRRFLYTPRQSSSFFPSEDSLSCLSFVVGASRILLRSLSILNPSAQSMTYTHQVIHTYTHLNSTSSHQQQQQQHPYSSLFLAIASPQKPRLYLAAHTAIAQVSESPR